MEENSDLNYRVAGVTKGGKELVIVQTNPGYLKVQFTTGGQLPPALTGKFTRYENAQHAVDAYLSQEKVSSQPRKKVK